MDIYAIFKILILYLILSITYFWSLSKMFNMKELKIDNGTKGFTIAVSTISFIVILILIIGYAVSN